MISFAKEMRIYLLSELCKSCFLGINVSRGNVNATFQRLRRNETMKTKLLPKGFPVPREVGCVAL